jgi:pimeloyl-ACP methyl ester carboxylesterase
MPCVLGRTTGRRFAGLVGGLALVFAIAAAAVGQDLRPKVLIIGIDGVRTDVMAQVETPNLDRLAAEGARSMRARTTIPTISGPAWSSMLTGAWPEKHGVFNNDFSGNRYAEYPDIFTRIEAVRPELETFVAADGLPLGAEDSGGPLIGDAPDAKFVVDGYDIGWAEGDRASTEAALEALSNGDPDAMFVYLGNPDETSHQTSSIDAPYREAIEEADRQVGRLLEALRGRASFAEEDWLVLVSTDHGRRPNGGHGGRSEAELTTFFIASGPSAVAGEIEGTPRVVDVAVTALAHLGIEIDPAWRLDGRPVGIAGAETGWLAGARPLELRSADGSAVFGELHGDVVNARALLLLFHQGGANAHAEYASIIPRLLRNGYAALAIDARAGGSALGGTNRTMAALGGEPHYCEAYPDLVAALDHARSITGELPIVAWGSSYSGALVMRLASEHPDAIRAVLAFSPAGGEPMGDCPADRFAEAVTQPTFVLRPRSEHDLEGVREQNERFGRLGFRIHVADPGRHGSSMLNPVRVEGDTEPTWEAVLEFLALVTAR